MTVRVSNAATDASQWTALLAGAANTDVRRGSSEPSILSALYDDPRAPSVYSGLLPGVDVSRGDGVLQLLARFRNPAQGGELANPPPLAATRLVVFAGLVPEQAAAIAKLFVATVVCFEGADVADPPALGPAIEAARAVVDDPRARGKCVAPCKPWPLQTRWSLLTTFAFAAWRLGERNEDAALLRSGEASAREALAALPTAGYPLTSAVSLRLLGTLSQVLAERDPRASLLDGSVSATRQAAALFQQANQRYDRAFTLHNLQGALLLRSERDLSPRSCDEAMQASDETLALLPEDGSPIWFSAIAKRVDILRERWERSEDIAWLTQAKSLLERAEARVRGASGAAAEQALASSLLCEVSSAIAFERRSAEDLARSVAGCDQAEASPAANPSVELSVRQRHGLALARLGFTVHDRATLRRGVELLEHVAASAERLRAVRFRSGAASNYAWGLRLLSDLENRGENLRKAAVAIGTAAWPGSRETAPIRWARIRQFEGKVLLSRGWFERTRMQTQAAIELYRQAQAAFGDVQTVLTKREAAKQWAYLEELTGEALAREGEIGRHALFAQSLQHYQRALAINQEAVDAQAFARTQFGMGRAYLFLADQEQGLDRIRRAAKQSVSALRVALAEYRRLGLLNSVADTEAHLADAVAIVERVDRSRGCETLALLIDAIGTDPNAHGLWERASESLGRSDPENFGPATCPSLDRDAWMRIRARADAAPRNGTPRPPALPGR